MSTQNHVAQGNVKWPSAGHGQIPSLDGLRAVSILLVFCAHAGLSNLIPGGFGVTIFFFLSGFLITTLLCREHARTGSIAFGAFYLRRLLRLGPPLLLTVILAVLLTLAGWAVGDLSVEAILAQVFFVFNYYSLLPESETSVKGLGILWSLAVEEHFYLIWPALFYFIALGKIGVRHIVGLLVLILIWRCVRVLVFDAPEWTIYISTDTRFDSLLYGCLLALLMARNQVPDWVLQSKVFYLTFGLALMGLLVSFFWRDPIFRSTLRYTLQGIALLPIFFYAIRKSDHFLFRSLNYWMVRKVGLYSYTFYLIHFVVLQALWNIGYEEGGWLSTLYAATFSLVWAALVYRFAEQPLHGLRQRLNAP